MVEAAHHSYGYSTGAFSVTLEISGTIFTGLKVEKNKFKAYRFRKRSVESVFESPEKYPIWSDLLAKSVTMEADDQSISKITMMVMGHCRIVYLVIAWLTFWRQSMTTVSPNTSARSFNESESEFRYMYCSTCNGGVRDWIDSKSLFWSDVHCRTFPIIHMYVFTSAKIDLYLSCTN